MACRASAFSTMAACALMSSTFAYNLYANQNLAGVAGTYTLTQEGEVKKVNGEDYTGSVIFQSTQANDIAGDMTVNVESGTHTVSVLGTGGTNFNFGTQADPLELAINVSGDSNITFGVNNLLYSWSQDAGVVNVYADMNINVNTSGTVSALFLTAEANNETTAHQFHGNQNVTITAGHVAAVTGGGIDNLSLTAGSKSPQIVGDINYTLH